MYKGHYAGCKDYKSIENYDKAINDSKRYVVHHRLETHTSDGHKRLVDLSKAELIALDMYYNRPADELIFIEYGEHTRLHCKGKQGRNSSWLKGKHVPNEIKNTTSKSMNALAASYRQYKSNGGEMTWNQYQHSCKRGIK